MLDSWFLRNFHLVVDLVLENDSISLSNACFVHGVGESWGVEVSENKGRVSRKIRIVFIELSESSEKTHFHKEDTFWFVFDWSKGILWMSGHPTDVSFSREFNGNRKGSPLTASHTPTKRSSKNELRKHNDLLVKQCSSTSLAKQHHSDWKLSSGLKSICSILWWEAWESFGASNRWASFQKP